MAEALGRSALAHFGLSARAKQDADKEAGVTLGERPFRRQVTLRGDAGDTAFLDAVRTAVGVAPPVEPNSAAGPGSLAEGGRILWLGPDEWLVVGRGKGGSDIAGAIRRAIDQAPGVHHAAVVDVSDGRAVITLAGPHARNVLAKGCPLDFHPKAFEAGRCAQSLLGKAHIIIHQVDEAPTYEIYVHRSFADYLWRWLQDAAAEYGAKVVSA